MYDLAIMDGLVYLNGKFVKTNVYTKDGIITKISKDHFDAKEYYIVDKKLVIPGLIDPHVHFNLDLGFIKSVDNFYSGSVAAAYGGVTTFIDFLEPVSNKKDLIKAFNKRLLEAKNSVVDYKFHATVKNPKGKLDEITEEMKNLKISSVKLFTTYSNSNRRTYDNEIKKLLELSKEKGFLILAHIENDDLINLDNSLKYNELLKSRSTESETSEALKLASYAKKLGGRLYMVHLSSGYTLEKLKKQYSDILNKNFFIESCPHYFTLTADLFERSDGYLYTLAPPLRTQNEVNILNEDIDSVYTIGTDHCPFMKKDKTHNLLKDIPLGIGSIEHSFDIMYSLFQNKIIDKMTINVAKVHNLYPQKGVIQVGSDADMFIYNTKSSGVISENHSRCDYSVYNGRKTLGKVETTISRGKFIIKDGKFLGGKGKYLSQNK